MNINVIENLTNLQNKKNEQNNSEELINKTTNTNIEKNNENIT